jgi:hypothetical protein
MSHDKLARFSGEKYLNLESYRKNGKAVRTPMWFAESGGALYVYSLASAGKVKRITNNPRVRVVPSGFRGKPRGEWVDARARILDADGASRGHALLTQKYGWRKRIGDAVSKLRKRQRVVIIIEIAEQ